jgi:hypothetical protein
LKHWTRERSSPSHTSAAYITNIGALPETRPQRHLFHVLQQAASCWSAVPPIVLKVPHPAHTAIYSPLPVSLIPHSLTQLFS